MEPIQKSGFFQMWRSNAALRQIQLLKSIHDIYDQSVNKHRMSLADAYLAAAKVFLFQLKSIETILVATTVAVSFIMIALFSDILTASFLLEAGFWLICNIICCAIVYVTTIAGLILHFRYNLSLFSILTASITVAAIISAAATAQVSQFMLGQDGIIFDDLVLPLMILFVLTQWLLFVRHRDEICFSRYSERMQSTNLEQFISDKLRGKIILIEAQDHYVQVTTDKGQQMLRMRFKDAIARVSANTGVLVHRSYWVTNAAFQSFSDTGDKPILTLTNGVEVPVSPAHIENVQRIINA